MAKIQTHGGKKIHILERGEGLREERGAPIRRVNEAGSSDSPWKREDESCRDAVEVEIFPRIIVAETSNLL